MAAATTPSAQEPDLNSFIMPQFLEWRRRLYIERKIVDRFLDIVRLKEREVYKSLRHRLFKREPTYVPGGWRRHRELMAELTKYEALKREQTKNWRAMEKFLDDAIENYARSSCLARTSRILRLPREVRDGIYAHLPLYSVWFDLDKARLLRDGLISNSYLVNPEFVDPQMIVEIMEEATLSPGHHKRWIVDSGYDLNFFIQNTVFPGGPTFFSFVEDALVKVRYCTDEKIDRELIDKWTKWEIESLLSIPPKKSLKLKFQVVPKFRYRGIADTVDKDKWEADLGPVFAELQRRAKDGEFAEVVVDH